MKKILGLVVILFTVAFTSQAEVNDTSPSYNVVFDIGSSDNVVAYNSPTAEVNKVFNVTVNSVNYKDVGGSASVISNIPSFSNTLYDYVTKYITQEIFTSNTSLIDIGNKDTSTNTTPKTSKRIATNIGKYLTTFS